MISRFQLFALLAFLFMAKAAAGQTWVTAIDSMFEEQAADIIEAPDKSLYFVGYQCINPLADPCTELIFVKLDSNGQLIFFKKDSNFIEGSHLKRFGNRFFVLGHISLQGAGGLVLDEDGTAISSHSLGGYADYLTDFDRMPNGDFAISGTSYFSKRPILIQTDSLFNTNWSVLMDTVNSKPDHVFVNVLADGNIQVWAQSGTTVKLRHFDAQGNQIFEKTVAAPTVDISSLTLFFKTKDLGLVAIRGSFGNDDLHIVRFNADGDLVLDKKLELSSEFNNFNIEFQEFPNGDFLIAETVKDNGQAILTYSPNGILKSKAQWQKPCLSDFFINKALLLHDGGLVIAGSTAYLSKDTIYIVKWDTIPTFDNQITGTVFSDDDKNCQKTPSEKSFSNQIVVASNASAHFFGSTDTSGFYRIFLPTGPFSLHLMAPTPLFESCPDTTLNLTQNDSIGHDFGLKKLADCPFLTTQITVPRLRRCFESPAVVEICNLGTIAADTAHLDLTIGPWLSIASSDHPFQTLGVGKYRFPLDTLEPFDCLQIHLQILTDCDSATLGQTHCLEAHVFPDSICLPTNPAWSGASIELDSRCLQDSVHFTIENVGDAPTSQPVEYIVIEDDVILHLGSQPLDPGDQIALAYAAGGHFWRLESSQEPGHPNDTLLSVSSEGCGGFWPNSFGFWPQFSNADASPAVDIDCLQNTASYDPNEKEGYPLGIDNQHFIAKNTDLEYVIHFQNTGTDTAFTVVIRDTLDGNLAVENLRMGAASHPFSWKLSGAGALEIRFKHIDLPDSTTNLAASQGFVSMTIPQRPSLADGTQIRNRAAIFFDFNAPVLTNQTLHTIGSHFLKVETWSPVEPIFQLKVFPNPTSDEATFLLEGIENQQVTLQIFDLSGRAVVEKGFSQNALHFKRDGLPNGLYFFKIETKNGRLLGGGKLLID